MNVVFRTDASLAIGTGHVMRCLTLASALRERGSSVSFVCREHDGHLCGLIREWGFSVSSLPAPKAGTRADGAPAHAAWLGATWQQDAEQTRAAIEISGVQPDWLVVDHYALAERWECALRKSVGRIMVIDDLADRLHDCDMLLDQNLVTQMHSRYANKVPVACGMLLGPKYALLQPIYADLHDRIPPRNGPIRRILISFGGVDRDNLTGRAVAAFLQLNRPEIEVDVIIALGNPHARAIRQQAAAHTNIHLHSGLPSLAPLMAKADLAIGAGGATSWERMCLGLPTLVVSLAENQRAIADGLGRRGLIRWLGHHVDVDEQVLSKALGEQIKQGSDEDWSQRCLEMVDGKGVDRVCAALTVTAFTPFRVRHARLYDEALLVGWANDPTSHHKLFSAQPVNAETHQVRFRQDLRNLDGCCIYIVETTDGVALGRVRFERHDQAWEIDCIHAPFFGARDLRLSLLAVAMQKFRADVRGALMFGHVKKGGKQWRIAVCSDADSWINAAVPRILLGWLAEKHQVTWVHDVADLPAGDICFYLSYGRIVNASLLARHQNNLVVHASDLPKGRGWSPWTWQILEGKNRIPVTLFEAAEAADSGPIYRQVEIQMSGVELIDELRTSIAQATLELCRDFVEKYPAVVGTRVPQKGEPTFYARRRPEDSRLDIDRPLREQFNLLRTTDSEHYPAWFEFESKRFALKIENVDNQSLNEDSRKQAS